MGQFHGLVSGRTMCFHDYVIFRILFAIIYYIEIELYIFNNPIAKKNKLNIYSTGSYKDSFF